MKKNRPVIIYGAGFRGGRFFLALAEENEYYPYGLSDVDALKTFYLPSS